MQRSATFLPPAPLTSRRWVRAMHALALLSVAVSTYYLTWRGLSTLDTDVPALAGVLYVAEIYIFLRLVGFLVVTWETDRHAPFALRDDASVDVFITTYDEPADIVRATALGALAMEHPHRTVILDDGRRKEIRAIAAELGCDYLTRADNTGHKAGNLNNALQHSSADFIAVFDADHVPQQAFLRRTPRLLRGPGHGAGPDATGVLQPRLPTASGRGVGVARTDALLPRHPSGEESEQFGVLVRIVRRSQACGLGQHRRCRQRVSHRGPAHHASSAPCRLEDVLSP